MKYRNSKKAKLHRRSGRRCRATAVAVLSSLFALSSIVALDSSEIDLKITEIMYHPVASPVAENDERGEFLELFNHGDTVIDLTGFRFDRGVSYQFPEAAFLFPGEYLVLAKDPAVFATTVAEDQLLGGYEGRLSNGGERLRLVDTFGNEALELRYGFRGTWPAAANGTGHSLVFKPSRDNQKRGSNWKASHYPGGSPGQADPEINAGLTRHLIGEGTRGRYFKGYSEPADGSTRWTRLDFQPDRDWVSGRNGFGYSNNPEELNGVATLLHDMRNDYLSLYVRLEFEVTQRDLDAFRSLVLEMHYDDAYVAYLNGIRIDSENVEGNPPAFDQASSAAQDYAPRFIDLSEKSDLLTVGFNVLAIQGHNAGLASSSDFVLFPRLDLTTDAANDSQLRKIVINEVQVDSDIAEDFVELYNPTDRPIDLGGMWLSDRADRLDRYRIPRQTVIAPRQFLVFSQSDLGFGLSAGGDQIFLTAPDRSFVASSFAYGSQISDTSIGRYPDGGDSWHYSDRATPKKANNRHSQPAVQFTELMYHDPRERALEYLELRVNGNQPIDASDWHGDGVRFRFDSDTVLEPERHYLIAADVDRLAAQYDLPANSLLGDYVGNLSHGGETVSLLDGSGVIIDSLTYDDEVPWPTAPDGLGSSLERHCFDTPSFLSESWTASPLDSPSPGLPNRLPDCEPPDETRALITEFVYHSPDRTRDERLSEFIEITHNSIHGDSDLSGWSIVGDVNYRFPPDTILPARSSRNKSLIVAFSPDWVIEHYSLDPATVYGPYTGDLSNGGGEITLLDAQGQIADQVIYDDDFPWPSIADGQAKPPYRDVSLKRLVIDDRYAEVNRWTTNLDPDPGHSGRIKTFCEPRFLPLSITTEPAVVVADVEPKLIAEYSGHPPDAVRVEYWVDDPESESKHPATLYLTREIPVPGAKAAPDRWTVTLPAYPANSIVRYRLVAEHSRNPYPSPNPDLDAFEWHAYFVDPQVDSGRLADTGHLFVSSANWRRLHDAIQNGRTIGGHTANPLWNLETPAVFVADNIVHDVMVRHQGSRSNRRNGSTIDFDCNSHRSDGRALVRSWRIEFPSYRKHRGMDTIILQKQSGWPQHISWRLFEKAGIPAPQTGWMNLSVNGCRYNSDAFLIERPGRDLVDRWFDEIGDLFKSQGYTGNEGPWSWGDGRTIRGERNGYTQEERYEFTYNRKTLNWKNRTGDGVIDGPEALIEGLRTARRRNLEFQRAWLAENFDVDLTLRYICTINYVGTFDDMWQNYFLYRKAEDGKWCLLPWDLDRSLGGDYSKYDAHPYRGANRNDIGNRNGWWNFFKDTFIRAYEPEFLTMFHYLNNTVFASEQVLPVVQEAAALRGFGDGAVTALMRHIQRRHDYLNEFLKPRLAAPELTIARNDRGLVLAWPAMRPDYALYATETVAGVWKPYLAPGDSRIVLAPNRDQLFFLLYPRP